MLTIGQMSKVCGVSVKTLRHYDKIGLLKPQKTDEINGYRYYEDAQIGTMLLIGRLKRYGFSLTEIQSLLTIPDSRELLRQLHKQRFRLERQMEHIAREHLTINGVVMAIYHDQEFDPAYSDIELGVGITEREKADFVMQGCLCATTIHKGAYSGLPDAYGAIVAWINANGYHMNGMPYEIYRKTQFDKLPPDEWVTEIFFPVKK